MRDGHCSERKASEEPKVLRGWGGHQAKGVRVEGESLTKLTEHATLSRGLGRSYGDSALPAKDSDRVLLTERADRVLAWNDHTGVLRAEAGLSLEQLNDIYMPRGWFTPVSPGTKFVTLGGMVAADVHGKNHHVDGCIGEHIETLRMRVASGEIISCSRKENADLFCATIGGMGLTGHILEVTLRMRRISSPWIYGHTRQVKSIDAYIDALKEAAANYPYTMGWIDCVTRGKDLGRGVLFCGDWATTDKAPGRYPKEKVKLRVPFDLPSVLLNRLTVRAFNEVYYRANRSTPKPAIIHPDAFFYPLDAIHDWYRLYGKAGFTQYQCVLPDEAGRGAAGEFLKLLTKSGAASPLCVIKDCGPEGVGMLSFPLKGISIAVDIPVRYDTQHVIDQLNAFVIDHGGRIYLAKDSFTRANDFAKMDRRIDGFMAVREKWDPKRSFRSAQSVRIFGDPL